MPASIPGCARRIVAGGNFRKWRASIPKTAAARRRRRSGWLGPGDTVPEFEKVMDGLKIGELSAAGQIIVRLAPDPRR